MKVVNNKIVEATESELYDFWLRQDWWELYSFTEYKQLCEEAGTKIVYFTPPGTTKGDA